MLSRLIQQLVASCGVVFRTFRAFFSRQITSIIARIKSVTSLTRQASKLAPAMMKTAANASKKPTRREDYIETKQLFISKSFVIMTLVMVASLAALFLLVIWPWLMSQFFTAKMWYEDPDVAGYTGKVILYYEESKDTIRFEGRLEEGVIQGEGRFYDENGLLVYRGNYENGVYSGEGTLYTGGALAYEGTFAGGTYSGEGKLYGPGERLVYKGTFADGLYNGEGVLYDQNGKTQYKGGFADGLYSGAGTLTVSPVVTIEATFEAGAPMGVAKCYDEGTLYYEGELKDLAPEGAGTLYSATGEKIYVGPMKNGTVDGAALLGATADDIRGMLGDKIKESSNSRGFAITSEALGLTAFCSFAQGGEDPQVYYIYLYGPKKDIIPGLIWSSEAEFEALAMNDEVPPILPDEFTALPSFATEVPVALKNSAFCQRYRYEDHTLRLWSSQQGGAVLLLEWQRNAALPTSGQTTQQDPVSAGSAGRLEGLMEQLGLASEGAAGSAASNPYYGSQDVSGVLTAVEAGARSALASSMQTYFEYAERRAADEENLTLYTALLEEAKAQAGTGQGDPLRIAQLEDAVTRLELEISKHMVEMKKAGRAVTDSTGLETGSFDLQTLIPLFDVAKLDTASLGVAIVSTAMEAAQKEAESQNSPPQTPPAEPLPEEPGEGETLGTDLPGEVPPGETPPAETPPTEETPAPQPAPPAVDAAALLRDMEDSVLALALTHQSVNLALQEYKTAVEAAATAAQGHSMGTVTNGARIEAQIAANEKRAALYTALADFARQTTALNESSGGWLAAEIGWLPQVMGK